MNVQTPFKAAGEPDNSYPSETKEILDSSESWANFCERQKVFDATETYRLNALMAELPPAAVRIALDQLLHPTLYQTEAVQFEKHALGVWFTLWSVMNLIRSNKETVNMEGKIHVANPKKIHYEGHVGDRESEAPVSGEILIDDTFTIMRGDLPFIYKSKYHPARKFGTVEKLMIGGKLGVRNAHSDRKQLLKFQAAIEHGLIAGAAVEVRGLIDHKFLKWASGTDAFNSGAIPDVQIIYNVPLPSGAEYRFTLKKATDRKKELTVENDESLYNEADLDVIRGLKLAQETYEIYKLVSGEDLIDGASAAFKDAATYEDIRNKEEFSKYMRLTREGLWQRARAIVPGKYNFNENTIFADRNLGIENRPEVLEAMLEDYQQLLRLNEHAAHSKANYILGEPGTPEYAEKKKLVVQTFAKNIAFIRAKEDHRRAAPDFLELDAQRENMGWRGPKEGIGLSMDHIMCDSIVETLATLNSEKKGRSYEHPADRFMNIDKMMAHLAQEKDRVMLKIDVHDPQVRDEMGEIATTTHHNSTEFRLGRMRIDAMRTNIRRALKYIDDNYGRSSRRKNNKQRDMYESNKDEIKRLQNQLVEDKKRTAAQEKVITATRKALKVKELSPDHPAYVQQEDNIERLRQTERDLWATLATSFEDGERNKLFQQVFSRRENKMKFIYAIRSDNTAVYDEESRNYTGMRASHSELIGGEFGYGAGEIVFMRDEIRDRWIMTEINNGSGHYRPPTLTLKFASDVIWSELTDYYRRQGMDATAAENAARDIDYCTLTDSIARGRPLQDDGEKLKISKAPEASKGARAGAKAAFTTPFPSG